MGDRPKATTTTTTTTTTITSASPGGAAIASEVTAMAATVPQEAAQANGAGNGPATGNGNAGNGNGNGNGGNGNVGSPQEPGAAGQVDQPGAGDPVQPVDAAGLPSGGDGGDDAATDAGASSLPPSEIGGRQPLDTACSDGGGASSLAGGIVGPPSPLTGCYLLIVMGEPHSEEHKDNILQHLLKGKCYVLRATRTQHNINIKGARTERSEAARGGREMQKLCKDFG